ncbi:MAG: hypothetical protein QN183_01360 [Armatimonadota bacterium]|nr:hypothetical protein [Armatimonadota bacterium]MDR7534450.1 hypothetical protein [Armatimonadota bacterium]MDR7534999.1 hypothetical protein [Armatimonadota bacterium]
MFEVYRKRHPRVEIINATVAGGAGTNAKAVLKSRMQGGDPPTASRSTAARAHRDLRRSARLGRAVLYLVLAGFTALYLLPVYVLVNNGLKAFGEVLPVLGRYFVRGLLAGALKG